MTQSERNEKRNEMLHELLTRIFDEGASATVAERDRADAVIILGTSILGALMRLADAQERIAAAAEKQLERPVA